MSKLTWTQSNTVFTVPVNFQLMNWNILSLTSKNTIGRETGPTYITTHEETGPKHITTYEETGPKCITTN